MRYVAAAAVLIAAFIGVITITSNNEDQQTPEVSVTDNAFVRGVDRPTVTINAGEKVVWHWTSQQSHGVSVRSGPESFEIPVRTEGHKSHTFTKVGTYQLECPLHAPGMKMTVVVD